VRVFAIGRPRLAAATAADWHTPEIEFCGLFGTVIVDGMER